MRWILTAASAAVVCSGCGAGKEHALAPPTCAARITWNGHVYFGETFAKVPPATLMLGTGGRPTCADANGGEAGASQAVEVRRMIGVDPRVAVAVEGEREHAYLARGYFVQLPSHPLHRALGRFQRTRSELEGCATTRRLAFRGTVRSDTGATLAVRRGRRETVLFVDAFTRFQGLDRNGLPYVEPGERIAVGAVECRGRDGRLHKTVPRRIAPA